MRKWVYLAGVLIAVVSTFIYLPRLIAFLHIGTTFAAQQTCACVNISNRTLDACKHDLGTAASLLGVEIDGNTVRAKAFGGLFSGESLFDPPFGCHPVK